jgi:streptogramin lyase
MLSAPSGEVWFAENRAHRIGRIDRAGLISEYPMPERFDSGPTSITVMPDGGVWTTAGGPGVTDPARNTLVRNSVYEFDSHGNWANKLFASTAYATVPAISQSLTR